MSTFIHLHVNSEYSLLNSVARIEELVKKAEALGMKALAITDQNNLYGAIPFYLACQESGIKPIIGCEMRVSNLNEVKRKPLRKQEEDFFTLVLLAENYQGYQNLLKLVSVAQTNNYYLPYLPFTELIKHYEGLTIISDYLNGEIGQALLKTEYELAKKIAFKYKEYFGEHFYLEITNHHTWQEDKIRLDLIKLSKELTIPLVATNHVKYIEKSDYKTHTIIDAIGRGITLAERGKEGNISKEYYFRSSEEMEELFFGLKDAILNSNKIVEKINLELEFNQAILPKFPLDKGIDSSNYLKKLAFVGANKRFHNKITSEIQKRLNYELSVIEKMGFADYFLIVWDIMLFAHKVGIRTGPGRGSAAGSLVAYVLGITNINPIEHKLLFERFLNPDRVSMPDIDIDFQDERRDEVIEYVKNKYGRERVAQIITFGTMGVKGAIRDVGRVLGIPLKTIDKLTKMISNNIGVNLAQELSENQSLRELKEKNQQINELLTLVEKVEGLPRHTSTHAAGVVIAKEDLTNYLPLQKGSGEMLLTQYSMEILEKIGLLKMDFLGLKTLSLIQNSINIWEVTTSEKIKIDVTHFDDQEVYQLLSKGNTLGVFQLESAGIRKVLKEMEPNNFNDIVAVLALYRPGPMEQISTYIQGKKQKREIEYLHPSLIPVLADTYGILVYQEQIMQIASIMAGFSLGEADLLRRAIGKKKKEVLIEQREHFLAGSRKKGYDEETANKVYDLIVRFANYGFNRSHAAAYAVIAYQTAYLKVKYPLPFFTSLLSEHVSNPLKLLQYINDAKKVNIKILQPDINYSFYNFVIENEAIRYALSAIKNVGYQAIKEIIRERENGLFVNLYDFLLRVDTRVVNKRVIESLIYSGAMDRFSDNRAELIAQLDMLLGQVQKDDMLSKKEQIKLFRTEQNMPELVKKLNVKKLPVQQMLRLEKEYLGFYFSSDPLTPYQPFVKQYLTHLISELSDLPSGTKVVIAGFVVNVNLILTKMQKKMGFFTLEQENQQIECIAFPEVYQKYHELLKNDNLLFVKGMVQVKDEKTQCIVEKIGDIINLAGI